MFSSGAKESIPPSAEKSARDAPERPGTAGTEIILRSKREAASTAFKRAHRAEQAYIAHKQANVARQGMTEAKEHFKQSKTHLKAGCGLSFLAMKAIPHVLSEKRELRRAKTDAHKREQAEKKREHYEKLAQAAAEAEAAEDPTNPRKA